jgi:formylglycine-generating enzyme required for sulfatase activity
MKKSVLSLAFLLSQFGGFCQGFINIQMAYVKGGSFFRGCDDRKYSSEEFDNEKPVHRVHITSYYMGKYEITQGQWRKVMGILPDAYTGTDYINKDCDDCPVVKVNYEEVQEFIKRLNEKSPGKHYRLPTELEWEFAARGGMYSGDYKYAGSNKLSTVGWYGKTRGATHPVGQKQPNELGIYDMSGNVLEWCTDWYDADYYKTTTDAWDPKGPSVGEKKVLRGGSYYDDDYVCRNFYRSRFSPKTSQWNIGFRLATDN